MRMVVGSVVFSGVLLVALVFSAAGLYALMAVAVARRTREIGIRVALGANSRRVLGSVFARAARQLGGGIIAGNSIILLLAWRANSLTADLLVTSVITSVIMAAVGVLACAAPARRALRVQPTEALRQV
jgi:ABC-type antimicrobial peptide transport system permease subunit